jgi:hypothetical protein
MGAGRPGDESFQEMMGEDCAKISRDLIYALDAKKPRLSAGLLFIRLRLPRHRSHNFLP